MSTATPLTTHIELDSELTSEAFDIVSLSQVLKACGDGLRLQILQVLRHHTFGVLELTQLFQTKQSGMSHHLKILSSNGLVEAQREGNAIFYRRPFIAKSDHDQSALDAIFALVDRFQIPSELHDGIERIYEQRAVQSQAFFAKNIDRFKEQQELICDYDQYATASFDLLKKSSFDSDSSVLEIGPGEGAFLKKLSRLFNSIHALDNSEAMLNEAKKLAIGESLANISFHLGDSRAFKNTGIQVDAVVMNMVLHHVPNPADIFEDIKAILKPGGVFVLCDLSHHNQEWAKENCGDLWLGFEDAELTKWATKSGLTELDSTFIGLRNGFQIQLRKYSS